MAMKDNSWYLFMLVTCINKEHCKETHKEDAFRNRGFDELRYLCRVFTNRFCSRLDCGKCSFCVSKNDDDGCKCTILNSINKLRGTHELI